jgi:hypothetical protein
MWAHQYDQQPNQITCSRSAGPWTTNGPESNLFGLEPHFGCCTANFHQGWPKLVTSLWMSCAEGGLAALVYAPCVIDTMVGDTSVRIDVATDYPFRDTALITVTPSRPMRFPVKLRVPGWSRSVNVTVNGTRTVPPRDAGFLRIDRNWSPGDRIEIAFDNTIRQETGVNGAVSIIRGPLVFALPVPEKWQKWRTRGLTADWEVYPAGLWNYALADGPLVDVWHPVSAIPFARGMSPITVTAMVVLLPEWTAAQGGYAEPPPQSPVQLTAPNLRRATLVPYGSAKLRVTEMPVFLDLPAPRR